MVSLATSGGTLLQKALLIVGEDPVRLMFDDSEQIHA